MGLPPLSVGSDIKLKCFRDMRPGMQVNRDFAFKLVHNHGRHTLMKAFPERSFMGVAVSERLEGSMQSFHFRSVYELEV